MLTNISNCKIKKKSSVTYYIHGNGGSVLFV